MLIVHRVAPVIASMECLCHTQSTGVGIKMIKIAVSCDNPACDVTEYGQAVTATGVSYPAGWVVYAISSGTPSLHNWAEKGFHNRQCAATMYLVETE